MSEPEYAPELDAGWAAMDEGNFDQAVKEALPHTQAANENLRAEANKLAGLAYFQLRDAEKALPHLKEVATIVNDAHAWFNVVTSAALAGDLVQADTAMDKVAQGLDGQKTDPEDLSLPQAKLYYGMALCDVEEFDKAFTQLEWLRGFYESYKVTDDTFLYLRGMPTFPHALQLMVRVFDGLDEKFDHEKWVRDFAAKLDDDGRDYILSYLEG